MSNDLEKELAAALSGAENSLMKSFVENEGGQWKPEMQIWECGDFPEYLSKAIEKFVDNNVKSALEEYSKSVSVLFYNDEDGSMGINFLFGDSEWFVECKVPMVDLDEAAVEWFPSGEPLADKALADALRRIADKIDPDTRS